MFLNGLLSQLGIILVFRSMKVQLFFFSRVVNLCFISIFKNSYALVADGRGEHDNPATLFLEELHT